MTLLRNALAFVSLTALAASGSCARGAISAEGTPAAATLSPPRLVVLITVDQLRGDMLDRYRGDLRHGYARLMRGAWFVNAFQDHAITETAPGHASTLSGRFPRSTGIMSNSAGVVDRNYRLLTGLPNEPGASPFRFTGTTLFDWLADKNSRARALSVSKKDRGAILPIGRAKQDVYWFSANGSFTTSTYYRDALPDWVKAFNGRRIAQQYAGAQWRLSRDPASYSSPDSVTIENRGQDFMFPHQIPGDTLSASAYLPVTPTMDSVTALFALEGVRQTRLGLGPHTDLLAVSFSATDYIGHTYGPDSREAQENEIRLDETIGWFLDSLYALRDSSSVMVVLTGDHGVQPNPSLARARGEAKANEGYIVSLRPQIAAVRSALAAAGADSSAFIVDGELVGVDRAALSRARLNADSLLDAFARTALQVPGVARVDRTRDIARADFTRDPVARRWSHQLNFTSDVDLVVTLTPYSYWYPAIATHGSPYDLDAHVPIIFYGPAVKPGRYTGFARVVDIAPTLAVIVGARPSEKLDGVVLTSALQR